MQELLGHKDVGTAQIYTQAVKIKNLFAVRQMNDNDLSLCEAAKRYEAGVRYS